MRGDDWMDDWMGDRINCGVVDGGACGEVAGSEWQRAIVVSVFFIVLEKSFWNHIVGH